MPPQALHVMPMLEGIHSLLAAGQAPYAAALAAYPSLPGLLERVQSGGQYLEVSTSFASPNPARYEACAPVAYCPALRGGGDSNSGSGIWADSSLLDASPLKDQYGTDLCAFITKHQGQPAPRGGPLAVSFRIASAALPAGTVAPWVRCSWPCDEDTCERLHQQAQTITSRGMQH